MNKSKYNSNKNSPKGSKLDMVLTKRQVLGQHNDYILNQNGWKMGQPLLKHGPVSKSAI